MMKKCAALVILFFLGFVASSAGAQGPDGIGTYQKATAEALRQRASPGGGKGGAGERRQLGLAGPDPATAALGDLCGHTRRGTELGYRVENIRGGGGR